MIALIILGYFILFILIFFALLILIPIYYSFEAEKYEDSKILGRISMFCGIFRFKISTLNLKSSRLTIYIIGIPITVDLNNTIKEEIRNNANDNVEGKEIKKKDNKKSRFRNRNKENIFEYLNKHLIEHCISFISSIWNSIKPDELKIKGFYGFDDPYYTAMVSAIIGSLYPLIKDYPIHLNPVFDGYKLEGQIKITGKISIITLLFLTVKFIVTKPIRKIIKNILRNKKEEKSYAN